MPDPGATMLVDAMRATTVDPDQIAGLVSQRLQATDNARLVAMSRETPTHYKWFLGADDSGSRVWLHEFKPASERSTGYVQSPHNHRYSFTAVVLAGSYRNLAVDVDFDEASLEITHLKERTRTEIAAGDRYWMSSADYHGLTDLADGTVSVVLESPQERPCSYSVNDRGSHVIRHVPLEERLDDLRSRAWRPPTYG